MILGFRSKETEQVFNNQVSKVYPVDIQRTALRKLVQIHAAVSLGSLRAPPGNHLEALHGDRAGQHSIRVNDQWRVCFVWQNAEEATGTPAGAWDVEIVDYH